MPAPGTYEIDVAHTTVEFVARHLIISKVRGRFGQFSGTITVGEVPDESSVEVTIDAASVDTAQEQRDEHLRSADFFDVAQYPTWAFRSTSVASEGGDTWKVTGDLTVRDVTKPVVLDVEFHGGSNTPWGSSAIGFSASAEVDREARPDLEPGPRDRWRPRGQEGPYRDLGRGQPEVVTLRRLHRPTAGPIPGPAVAREGSGARGIGRDQVVDGGQVAFVQYPRGGGRVGGHLCG